MKTYTVRIGCAGSQDIEVEANSEEEAKEEAINLFTCPTPEGEFIEFV